MLILVSTPIGNLGDISQRAIDALNSANVIACEDTRTSAQLFSLIGVKAQKLISYHEHNEESATKKIISLLENGVTVALVSDAGTPLISDPGYKIVRECRKKGLGVTTIPGANAVLSALQLSGLPTDAFLFKGFLPNKSNQRKEVLQKYKNVDATLIYYETANRLIDSLNDILEILGDREMAVVREITKHFEETKLDSVSNLINFYTTNGQPKGELVLVIDRAKEDTSTQDIDLLIKQTLKTNSPRDTAALIAKATGISKKEIYKKVLEHQNEQEKEI